MPLNIQIEAVGDGLNAALYTLPGAGLHLDLGGRSRRVAWAAFQMAPAPKTLVLSHFHLDHYLGLYEPAARFEQPLRLDVVIFPRLPQFQERHDFAAALFAALARVFGRETGSIEADFLQLIGALNVGSWSYMPVSQGDRFLSEGRTYEVLWPPDTIEGAFSKAVTAALLLFNRAREEDPSLDRIHSLVYESDSNPFEVKENGQRVSGRAESNRPAAFRNADERSNEAIPPVTRSALRSLTEIANRLSLAFRSAEELLFLGDLEESELSIVADDLLTRGLTWSQCLITAHHGTHWHSNLFGLRAFHAISSLGNRLLHNYRQEYSYISQRAHLTALRGSYVARVPFI